MSAVCKDGVCTSVRKVEGESCALGPKGDDRGECDVELYCEHGVDVHSEGKCARRAAPGESCHVAPCVLGAACDEGICTLPGAGSCWFGCADGFFCGDDLLCRPGTLALGDACGIVDGSFLDNECGAGLVCKTVSGSGMCGPPPGEGETCIYARCADGLFCHVSVESDALSICEIPRAAGDACSNDNVVPIRCADGLECRGDVCRAACD